MTAVAAWAAAQIRQRWPALVVLGVIAGLGGAATLTAVAGARRTATTYERHLDATQAAHVVVTAGVAPDLWTVDGEALKPILAAEGVDASTTVVPLLVRPVGTTVHIFFDRWVYGSADGRFGTEVNRFRIVEGRALDHRRPGEAVITPEYAELLDVGVGDTVPFESWTPAARDAAVHGDIVGTPTPDGPTFEVTVVGVAREFQPLLAAEEPTTVFLTEALTRKLADEVALGPLVGLVRLADPDGAEDFAAQKAEAVARLGPSAQIDHPTAESAGVAGAIDAQRLALFVFAIVTALTTTVIAFAGLARQLSFAGDQQRLLRALGMTRPQRLAGVALVAAPTALIAATVSAFAAAPASTLLPIGTPGRLEPSPGMRIDLVVLVAGAAAVVVAVAVAGAIVGWVLTGRDPSPAPRALSTATSPVDRLVRGSPPISIGVRMAFDRAKGTERLPSRSTLAGCVVGVTGTVAAFAFAASLGHLTTTPRLYGWAGDAVVGVGNDPAAWEDMSRRLEADTGIEEMATFITTYMTVEGQAVNALVIDPIRGDPVNVIVSGRSPRAQNEVVAGEAAADRLSVAIGDTVSVALADGSTRDYRLVGTAAHLPTQVGYRDSIGLLGDSVEDFNLPDDPWYGAAVTFGDGVNVDAAIRSLRDEGLIVIEPRLARSVANLDEVAAFPIALAALLGVLSITSLLHGLAVAARRRGHEFALLRALGFSTRQLRTTVMSHAFTLALIAVLAGLPLGLGAGRTTWATVSGGLGVPTEHIIPGAAIASIVAGATVAGLLGLPLGAARPAHHPPTACVPHTRSKSRTAGLGHAHYRDHRLWPPDRTVTRSGIRWFMFSSG